MHPLEQVISLRTVAVVQAATQEQLEAIRAPLHFTAGADAAEQSPAYESSSPSIRRECIEAAQILRDIETRTLETAIESMEEVCSTRLTRTLPLPPVQALRGNASLASRFGW